MRFVAIIFMLLGALAILVCAYTYGGFRGPTETVQNSGFADERFFLLLFPAGDDVSLERAVIATLAEYRQEFIEVYVDGTAVTMPRSGLVSVPPENYGAFVERLNQELSVWGQETDWSKIEYVFAPSEVGGEAVVTIGDKRGTAMRYTYLVEDSAVHPLEVRTKVDTARNLAD